MVKRISVFFNGMPEFENLFRITERLAARGKVTPVCFAPFEVVRREPRLKRLIAASGLNFTIRPNRLFKLFPKHYVKQADCSMVLTDPSIDIGPHRSRSQAILELGMPTLLVQHGVIQAHITFTADRDPVDCYSERILTFEALDERSPLSEDARQRARTVGFIKPVLFPPGASSSTLPDRNRTILFCHSFRWEGRYGQEDVSRFFTLIKDYAARHADDLLIVRSHRGKVRDLYKAQTDALSDHPNIVVSHAYQGPLKGMSMTDVLGLSDVCVSSASTAVLDSIYMDRPTAIYENDQHFFRTLPNVTDLTSLEAFLADPSISDVAGTQAHYGAIRENIERSCDVIEDWVTGWP